MNLSRALKIYSKVQSVASRVGVPLDIPDEVVDKWLNVIMRLAETDVSDGNPTRVSDLCQAFDIDLPSDRMGVIDNVLSELGVEGSALDLIMSGKIFNFITRNQDGSIPGHWERHSVSGEPVFIPSSL